MIEKEDASDILFLISFIILAFSLSRKKREKII